MATAPVTKPELAEGEIYAGIILGHDGNPDHHLILLAEEAEEITFEDATTWAKKTGGDLPTRREQHLLIANLKKEFKPAWYWSCEQPAEYSDSAWFQYFDIGLQLFSHKNYQLRARAVRRLVIE